MKDYLLWIIQYIFSCVHVQWMKSLSRTFNIYPGVFIYSGFKEQSLLN